MGRLSELAERCEKATGPDRELDAVIWATINGGYIEATGHGDSKAVWINDRGFVKHAVPLGDGIWRERDLLGDVERAPAYTASLDAAMTLVPEGLVPWFDWHHKASDAPGVVSYEAYVQRISDACTLGDGEGSSYALALTAAALRAIAAGEG
jgi:hypothetical protein